MTLVLLLAGALAVTWLVQSRGWSRGWRTWGVATGEVSWLDLRVVAGAAQTRSEGGDPYVSNPHDPMGRPFNYPSLWLALFPATGSVAVLAGGAAVVAAGVALLATGPTTGLAGGVIGLLLLSPALVLGVERGNTDLIVFALVGAGRRCSVARAGSAPMREWGCWCSRAC